MNGEEFKSNLKKYQMGAMNAREEEQFENELEKIDIYREFLDSEVYEIPRAHNFPTVDEKRILRRSQSSAYFRMGLVSLIISLLILPTFEFLKMALKIIP